MLKINWRTRDNVDYLIRRGMFQDKTEFANDEPEQIAEIKPIEIPAQQPEKQQERFKSNEFTH